jgi:hypothetical protein
MFNSTSGNVSRGGISSIMKNTSNNSNNNSNSNSNSNIPNTSGAGGSKSKNIRLMLNNELLNIGEAGGTGIVAAHARRIAQLQHSKGRSFRDDDAATTDENVYYVNADDLDATTSRAAGSYRDRVYRRDTNFNNDEEGEYDYGGGNGGGENEEADDAYDRCVDGGSKLLFPGYVPVAFKYWDQASRPRYWCLRMITSPWFERVSMLVILFNCITLGMYQPCNDQPCLTTRCILLNYVDHLIHVFFVVEMTVKIVAMGFYGKETYLAESWNRLDFFIVVAGFV